VGTWTPYREVMFPYDQSNIGAVEQSKISEIADYMSRNPSLQVGIDSSMDPRGTDPRNQMLSDQRQAAVRNALVQAGVPADRIQTGVRGDTTLVRDRRVGILVSTLN